MYGLRNYQWKTAASRVANRLLENYIEEGVFMTYTLEDFDREVKEELLQSLTEEDIENLLKKLGPEKRLRGLGLEERLRDQALEDIEKYLKKMKTKRRS